MMISCLMAMCGADAELAPFRPPAAPLVTVDPYFSVWSFSDHLYDSWPMHWTGKVNAMGGMIRVDGKPYRFMGSDAICAETVKQICVTVRPTQTVYVFEAGGVELTLTFTTPMLPDDLKLLTLPVTYLTFVTRATDGQTHDVSLYFDATAEWVVNQSKEEVIWDRSEGPAGLTLLRFGSKEQKVLEKSGDNIRIDWGYFYVALPKEAQASSIFAEHEKARKSFAGKGTLPRKDDMRQPRAAEDDWPVIACALSLGAVGAEPVRRHLLLAYDDLYSIEYMQQKLRPWWFQAYGSFAAMIEAASNGYPALRERCAALDAELLADARAAGGEQYARLIGLSYRHVFASGKVAVGPAGQPWFFHKECFSNGCIATVDVSYPAAPFFALLSPVLLKGMMEPVFEFARMPEWPWPFAPHDVGTYPKANGQVYGKGKLDRQMPVEECGNMILMAALAARAEGNAAFAGKHWDLLTQWADYLKEKGLDPENQLCTDDFAGHLAHNTNLSLKAINALGGYAMLGEMLGKPEAAAYRAAAAEMAKQWCTMADNGDRYRLTFDQPDSWSMKYNLVWDGIFGLGLFPPEVAAKEVAYYKTVQNQFGLPLDPRKDYTKSDWLVWCATLAATREDFDALLAPLYRFCQETPDRVPFTDWYDTKTAKCIGFRARPVIGGIYIKFLTDPVLWQKYTARAANE
jgi:hypothetical protein